jgi:hypothetical protein
MRVSSNTENLVSRTNHSSSTEKSKVTLAIGVPARRFIRAG